MLSSLIRHTQNVFSDQNYYIFLNLYRCLFLALLAILRNCNKSVFSLVNSAVNMTLPAFAAKHRAVALCCGAVLWRRAVAPCCGAVLRRRAVAPCCGAVLRRRAVALCCGAVAAERPSLSINISCPRGAQQQTHHTPLLRSNDGTDAWTDRQTDGGTLDRFIDPATHIMRAASTRKLCFKRHIQKKYRANYRSFYTGLSATSVFTTVSYNILMLDSVYHIK